MKHIFVIQNRWLQHLIMLDGNYQVVPLPCPVLQSKTGAACKLQLRNSQKKFRFARGTEARFPGSLPKAIGIPLQIRYELAVLDSGIRRKGAHFSTANLSLTMLQRTSAARETSSAVLECALDNFDFDLA
jgi:hypothetical protein